MGDAMRKYKKSSGPLLAHKKSFFTDYEELHVEQDRITAIYTAQPRRARCKCCDGVLGPVGFIKTGIGYIICRGFQRRRMLFHCCSEREMRPGPRVRGFRFVGRHGEKMRVPVTHHALGDPAIDAMQREMDKRHLSSEVHQVLRVR